MVQPTLAIGTSPEESGPKDMGLAMKGKKEDLMEGFHRAGSRRRLVWFGVSEVADVPIRPAYSEGALRPLGSHPSAMGRGLVIR